ncbi:hypothetical protein A1O1_07015 [Capronia coronata CBS 617.96]|uniref:2-oxoadipate dioxygenase/decarboxylase n=1 Tax=Capronia coronata CBS 617.96 TaxID=1182541 RepID=W9XT65_9EURO|nr:uncharacterized protein A1O1_07015 [Capronia coronata CBS 617.96]EXJ83393.1 hypothetical protein A1O1_07015 [Capronia coronata CBS 617.96]
MTAVVQTFPVDQDCSRRAQQPSFVDKDDLRTTFALAMSAMYKAEVPLYGDLVRIVQEVNQARSSKDLPVEERLDLERHGAIRLGTPHELRTVRRVFAQIGLHPVDYYDLSVAGLPMHATAFRPIDPKALSKNPFRIFTTLLRPELLRPEPRQLALQLLGRRNIFSDELVLLLGVGEEQGGFFPDQAERFIAEAMKTFKWHSVAAATHEDYEILAAEHPILADITCFNSAHINHLTPRTLDIEMAEARMKQEGLAVKSRIEGPPARQYAILLRQTSFLALREHISFPVRVSTGLVPGSHKARFGEIEQRGAALTAKGRRLYDEILSEALQRMGSVDEGKDHEEAYKEVFAKYPDDWKALLEQGLVFFECRCTRSARGWTWSGPGSAVPLSRLLEAGVVETVPITYEDFLPFSAAGIFRSNLHSTSGDDDAAFEPFEDRESLESALGSPISDSASLYARLQAESLAKCANALGIDEIILDILS